MQTAVIRGVLDDRLTALLGEHRSRGWEIRQLIPTDWTERPTANGLVRTVTHWSVVLESERPLPPP